MTNKIDLSPDFATNYALRMVSPTSANTSGWPVSGWTAFGAASVAGILSSSPNVTDGGSAFHPQTFICLMKGTKPADFSTIPTYESRSADILVSFPTLTSLTYTRDANTITVATNYLPAIATGTATWYWTVTRQWNLYVSGNYPANAPLIQQSMGTVGLPNSGADLEMQDVNLVSGTPYRIINMAFRFPTSWTY
jgi:hypothetical protein